MVYTPQQNIESNVNTVIYEIWLALFFFKPPYQRLFGVKISKLLPILSIELLLHFYKINPYLKSCSINPFLILIFAFLGVYVMHMFVLK